MKTVNTDEEVKDMILQTNSTEESGFFLRARWLKNGEKSKIVPMTINLKLAGLVNIESVSEDVQAIDLEYRFLNIGIKYFYQNHDEIKKRIEQGKDMPDDYYIGNISVDLMNEAMNRSIDKVGDAALMSIRKVIRQIKKESGNTVRSLMITLTPNQGEAQQKFLDLLDKNQIRQIETHV